MHLLLFILIFIVAIVVFGLSAIGYLLRAIFGIGRPLSRPRQAESGRNATGQQDYRQSTRNSTKNEEEIYSENVSGKRHKKIFTQDDGEYVDFEEVKE
ncbi:DUF4834 family protein [uncultured Bacteroides sp.]|uniref:DUF4834 family protein n=1 Tax=uncultured Bacteroides sp. TaxID=162156 RepID=UPI0025CF1D95|nr:DUF4834 family protein [uncultured Bacteroides sp.]